jgi:hypothetical protein
MGGDVAFITLTNSGYIHYTINCLKSLKKIGMSADILHAYVIGKEGYETLKKQGYKCTLINDDKNSNFQVFRTGNWADIVFKKFGIIYENLKKHKYVCITDGDIVFENKKFLQYLKDNIVSHDMLIQNDTDSDNNHSDLCSGFMYIASNEKTLSLFNPENVKLLKQENNWGDQLYINAIKKKLNYKVLPLDLFPNGKYYYSNNARLSPYMIHFNWIVGHEKEQKMRFYKKWLDYEEFFVDKKYSWDNHTITFLKHGKMKAFGNGTYTKTDTHTLLATFACRFHTIQFNSDYTEFTATSNGHSGRVHGKLM